MPKKRNKSTKPKSKSQLRKEAEIQARIESAGTKSAKKAEIQARIEKSRAEKAKKPEKPEPKPAPATRRPERPAYYKPPQTLDLREVMPDDNQDAAPDCRIYDVRFPAAMSLQNLFNAIRKDFPNQSGTLYITLDCADASKSGYDLSYGYSNGLFTRLERLPENNNSKKMPPLLANLLDRRIQKINAIESPEGLSWMAGLYPDIHGQEAGA